MVNFNKVQQLKKAKPRYLSIILLIIAFSFCFTLSSVAQYVPEDEEDVDAQLELQEQNQFNLKDRIFYTGGFGLQFGNLTYLEASPMIGLRITERLRAGVGATYIYFSDNVINYSTNIYGGRGFGQFDIYEGFFGHLEYEVLNGAFGLSGERRNINSAFIGGGYRSAFGNKFFGNIMVLYNLTADSFSPYTNPVVRVGIGYGL